MKFVAVCLVSLFSLILLAVYPSGCATITGGSSDSGLTGRLTITGSSTVAPLAMEMARRFEQQHPSVRIDVQSGGSGKGIADARNGIADIGMASRELKADELDLTSHKIAADGVSIIVHESNPVSELSNDQIADIYTGRINNWKQVGGLDQAITVVHKAEGRATLEVFLQYFRLDNKTVKPAVVVGDNEHGIKTVSAARGAIGYVSIGNAESNAGSGVPIRLLPIDGIAATTTNLAAGKFPVSRSLNFVTRDAPSGLARAFIEYCQSEEVHDQVVSQFFVPIGR